MSDSPDRPVRTDSFDALESDYANNVAYEQTIWDLKLLFGEYSDRLKGVEWHTSITVPWAQAKLMLYYLTVNVESYELQQGKPIDISAIVLPSEPEPPPNPDHPTDKAIHEMVIRNRQRLLDSLK